MYKFREHGNFRNPNWNSLRPEEYWKFDAPSPRLILNEAKRLYPEDPDKDIWDKWTSEETQYEYLVRLGLLTEDDRKFIERYSKEFWRDEKEDTDFREYQEEMDKIENSKKQEVLKNEKIDS
jgi:Fe-S cluster biosynthesis and repair protein YggX